MAKTLTFDVKGMTCDNCVHHVTEAIKTVSGVTSTEVSLSSNSARVQGDFDDKQIITAIEEEGYEATIRV
jgi:copper chaperone